MSPRAQPDLAANLVWGRGHVVRVALFGALAVFYGILMLPLTVVVAILWLLSKMVDRKSPRDEKPISVG